MVSDSSLTNSIAIYVHLPWCIKKCPYCDFNSHRSPQTPDYEKYTEALVLDLKKQIPLVKNRTLRSIFIGGGTPSLCPSKYIKKLLKFIKNNFNYSPTLEITLEANPGTVDSDNFSGYLLAGVNRLSIGIQSFNNRSLDLLGRVHLAEENYLAIEIAKKVGFERINLDIMYALPEQSIEQAISDIKIALSCAVEHISYYQLSIENNTLFHSQPPANIPNEDTAWEFSQQTHQLLTKNYFHAYEISAWHAQNKSNSVCLHNLNYWRFGDYIGIGAGAHGKLSILENEKLSIYRTQKISSPNRYMQDQFEEQKSNIKNNIIMPSHGMSKVSEKNILFEFMLNQLRLNEGFNLQHCIQSTGLNRDKILNKIQTTIDKGMMMETTNTSFKKTPLGERFVNDLLLEFM